MTKKYQQHPEEHISDVLDLASRASAVATASAIAETQAKSAPEKVRNDDGTITVQGLDEYHCWTIPDCVDCDTDIPLGRLELGRIRCVDCQSAREKQRKQLGY